MSQSTMAMVPTRRFGRTELQMPVFSCGGMRFQQGWNGDISFEEIERENQECLEATIHRALELGINHIETARGYGPSEMQLGRVLPGLPRDGMIVQTKVGPDEDTEKFIANFEKSMGHLKLDSVDLFSFHGINTAEILDIVLRPGGCLEIARGWQKSGRVRHIGFSTHGPTEVIAQACETGEFDYLNLHYYFVNQFNLPAIEAATRNDMGVFIISPTDKGGMLQKPSQKMVELCAPLTPMGFNDLWCLKHPQIHTLSVGADKPSDFDEHVEAMRFYDRIETTIAPVEARLIQEIEATFDREWARSWSKALPEFFEMPGDVNVRDILRVFTYGKSFDLIEWAKGRYNLLGNAGHWAPGENIKALEDEAKWSELKQKIGLSPLAARIPAYLQEAHELLKGEEKERLSKS